MAKHIDTLNEWYESAEHITKTNLPNDGDTIIYPGAVDGSYVIEPDTSGWESQIVFSNEECRILHRAPTPKPAWHDAVAVIASTDSNDPQVWVLCGEYWDGTAGGEARTDDLTDVTPLIEQKVTDEMVGRIRELEDDYGRKYFASHLAARELLHAALGLDPA